MFIKICGIRDVEAARACADLGVDAVGVVFAEGSPRLIDPDAAAAIVAALPSGIEPVGVVTDAPVEAILDAARRSGVRTAQLHGARPAADLVALRDAGLDVIVARRAGEPLDDLPPGVRVLVDGDVPGSGTAFSIDRLDRTALPERWILAGGLTPDNVAERIAAFRPSGVDVSSGVESSRGVKSIPLIEAFVAAVRATPDA